eukprot:scaffold75917_cov51-Phaeocystis_antarctica.AAC.1
MIVACVKHVHDRRKGRQDDDRPTLDAIDLERSCRTPVRSAMASWADWAWQQITPPPSPPVKHTSTSTPAKTRTLPGFDFNF